MRLTERISPTQSSGYWPVPAQRAASPAPELPAAALMTMFQQAQAQFSAGDYRAAHDALIFLRTNDFTNFHQQDRTLADSYSLGAAVARKLDNQPLAMALAQRGLARAEASGSTVALARATHHTALALEELDRSAEALTLLTATISTTPRDSTEDLAAAGYLFLTTAGVAAGLGYSAIAQDSLSNATNISTLIPVNKTNNTLLTDVELMLGQIVVYQRLGQTQRALELGRTIAFAALTTEQQGSLGLAMAEAWLSYGSAGRCLLTLQTVERLAPQEIRRPLARLLTRELLAISATPSVSLRAFARRIGLTS